MKKIHRANTAGLGIATAFAASSLLASASSFAVSTIDIGPRLKERDALWRANENPVVKSYVWDETVRTRLQHWISHEKNREYAVECMTSLRTVIPAERFLTPVCYFLRQDDPSRRAQYYAFIQRYLLEVRAAVSELAEDPRYADTDRARAARLRASFERDDEQAIRQCFAPALRAKYSADGSLGISPFRPISACLRTSLPRVGEVPYFSVQLAHEFPNHPGRAISQTGWIGGNKVEYLTENDRGMEVAQALASKKGIVEKLYPVEGAGSIESFASKIASGEKVFTEAEGFFSWSNDPNWTQKSGTYHEIRNAIDSARESIFIDIFFLGGTMGVSMAKHLVELIETRPGLKVFVLHDTVNDLGYRKEMEPVFNYLQAYSSLHPDRIVAVGSHIRSHRSGLPKMAWNLVTDSLIAASGLQKHLQIYARAVSDHSKVLVVDGKTAKSTAFVGSKNWTDSSGAWCFDDVVKIQGPAAAVVQDDYYADMVAALKNELKPEGLLMFAQKGWSKDDYREGQSAEAMIARILKPFDLLERDERGNAARPSVIVEASGATILRTGMNNVDSSVTSVLDQNIQAMFFAKKRILVRDQFLFDRAIVHGLIAAKRRNPSLDIRVLLEPLEDVTPKGMPNLLYLDLLAAEGIQVKFKIKAPSVNGIGQEYHMKTLSVDGECVIAGSANKDQTTMYGSFREEQVDICDRSAAAVHDEAFEDHWRTPGSSSPVFTKFDFEVPYGIKGVDGKPMAPDVFIRLIRNLIAVAYDAKEL